MPDVIDSPTAASPDEVTEALYDVMDPELGVNIVDLGLLYGVSVDEEGVAIVEMTLTSAACPLTDVLEDQVAQVLAQRLGEKMRERSGLQPRWVLGNESWLFGAVSLLYPGVADGFAGQVGRSFYILPSSVHEVILLPEGGRETKRQLYGMVAHANSRMQDREKFLSESVYYYDWEKREIRVL